MKYLILIYLLVFMPQISAMELPKGTASIKAYLFDSTLGSGNPLSSKPLLDKKFNLSKGIIGKSVKINEKQIKIFLNAFDDNKKFLPDAGCHIPHHGFVFYDKQGKAIGYYEVCFECGNVRSSIEAYQGVDINLKILKSLFKEVGFPILKGFKAYSKLYKEQNKNTEGHNTEEQSCLNQISV